MTPVSPWSVEFSRCLTAFMEECGITVTGVAYRMGRSAMYIASMTTMPTRAADTDLLDEVANQAGITARALVADITSRMTTPPPPDNGDGGR